MTARTDILTGTVTFLCTDIEGSTPPAVATTAVEPDQRALTAETITLCVYRPAA